MSELRQKGVCLAFGPMSELVIEAVFKYSHEKRYPLMLIASRNQVDYDGGYVFDSTEKYAYFIYQMSNIYPLADISLCRDHCGPGFKSFGNNSFESIGETIETDLYDAHFDMIHIDLCHLPAEHKEKIEKTCKLIDYAKSIYSQTGFEIGTDENIGELKFNLPRIEKDIRIIQQHCMPEFYVINTGTLVQSHKNIGRFDPKDLNLIAASNAIHKLGIKLKSHNCDYLSSRQIEQSKCVIDAMNIAPQLGVVQTMTTIKECVKYGINFDDFVNLIIKKLKWKKWLDDSRVFGDRYMAWAIAGHYHFRSDEYRRIYDELDKVSMPHISDVIMGDVMDVIDNYVHHFDK